MEGFLPTAHFSHFAGVSRFPSSIGFSVFFFIPLFRKLRHWRSLPDRGLMRLQPIVAEATVGDEGHGEVDGMLHLVEDDGLYPTLFFL